MTPEIYLLYVATVAALMSTPGPSHLLMLSNSLGNGFNRSLATAAGDLTANFFQMLFAGLGLAAIIVSFEGALLFIKWAGVAYLMFLGVMTIIKARNAKGAAAKGRASLTKLWLQGFVTSASNPKAVVFFAALFPQFISPETAFWPQFAALAATYIVMDGVMLCVYGAGAGWIGKHATPGMTRKLNTVGGGFMIAAAVMLGLKPIGQ